MAKMETLKHLSVGELDLENGGDVARIERNLFATAEGDTFEALRFCKNRHGRHNRVHLVIREVAFLELFERSVQQGVFNEEGLERLLGFLHRWREARGPSPPSESRDPFLEVIGIGEDGHLTENLDEELYGEGRL